MSAENIKSFFEKAKGDPELRGKIAEIARLESKFRVEALCRLSELVGTPFTAEELARNSRPPGELSEAQLDRVAGGDYEGWAMDAGSMFGYHPGAQAP